MCQGCFSASYVAQAARGEYEILHRARPIAQVVADPETPGRVRWLLLSVASVKAYGQAQGLKPTKNYRRYSDLNRNAAVWVVQACAPLAFDVKHWRFPIVGTIPYLGFFKEACARDMARSLSQEGLDVDVRVATAFSTLGWFSDPILSTMIPEGDEATGELANTILHESVHATIYVNNQSAFDESLASFVADRLTAPWLAATFGPDAPETRAWTSAQARERSRIERLHRAYVELEALYQSNASDQEKRQAKSHILAAAREELRLREPLNNAVLAGYKTYDTGSAAFERLLSACSSSWPKFIEAVKMLRESSFSRPQQEEFDEVIDRLDPACRSTPSSRP